MLRMHSRNWPPKTASVSNNYNNDSRHKIVLIFDGRDFSLKIAGKI